MESRNLATLPITEIGCAQNIRKESDLVTMFFFSQLKSATLSILLHNILLITRKSIKIKLRINSHYCFPISCVSLRD